jgi:hypothetical protein
LLTIWSPPHCLTQPKVGEQSAFPSLTSASFAATGEISNECLRRMIMVTFDVDAFQEGKRIKPKIWQPSAKRAAQIAKSVAKATELIRDDGKLDYEAYEELDKSTKIAVIRVIKDRCTDDGVNTAKISDECLCRMIAVEFDVSAFQEGMHESQLKRKREVSNRRRLKK